MRPPSGPRRRKGGSWLGLAWLLAVGLGATGCTSSLLDKKLDVSNILGPIGRQARDAVVIQQSDPMAPQEGSEELDAAKKLYEQKDYAKARKAFRAVAKKYKDKPVEEEAMFMIAECYYQLRHYPDAQDAYDELFKKYPSSRFLEKSTKRLYDIARYWLNDPPPPTEVELAYFSQEEPDRPLEEIPEARVPYSFPLTPNLLDRSRPLFDTPGRALQALKSVWINDPTGPLADDALMMEGTYHLRKGDYQEADRLFANIRENYSHTDLAPAAYLLGQHASYQSYQGAKYDGKQLEEARKLTDSALRMFPELPQRPKLRRDLEKMKHAAAEREYVRMSLYKKRREMVAAAVCAELLLRDFPDSPHADEARELLLKLGPEYTQGILMPPLHAAPSQPVDDADSSDEERDNQQPATAPGRASLRGDVQPIADEDNE